MEQNAKTAMTRGECESRITEKLREIQKIYEEYSGSGDYHLSFAVFQDYIMGNNRYWRPEDDKLAKGETWDDYKTPINFRVDQTVEDKKDDE